MVKKIIYVIFALAIGMLVYLISLTSENSNKQVEYLKAAFEENSEASYSNFLKFSTPYFHYEKSIVDVDYQIEIYKIIGKDEKLFFSYVIFISRLNPDKFKIAKELEDQEDKSDLLAYFDNELVYSYQDEMKGNSQHMAITHGIEVYGGYYYTFIPKNSGEYEVKLFDYEGKEFSNLTLNHQESLDLSEDLNSELVQNYAKTNKFNLGFTNQEKIKIIIGKVNRNMIIYGFIIVGAFLLIFRKSIFKRKKQDTMNY